MNQIPAKNSSTQEFVIASDTPAKYLDKMAKVFFGGDTSPERLSSFIIFQSLHSGSTNMHVQSIDSWCVIYSTQDWLPTNLEKDPLTAYTQVQGKLNVGYYDVFAAVFYEDVISILDDSVRIIKGVSEPPILTFSFKRALLFKNPRVRTAPII